MKFNLFTKSSKEVLNHENAKSYTLSTEMELYSAVATAGLNDTFYETANQRLDRIKELISKNKPEFTAQLAIYARNEMYMRSIPMVMAVELAKIHTGDSLVNQTVKKVVKRADEITEMLAYYQIANGRTGTKKLNRISKQIQKGLADSFNRFDEYQFAKYNRNGEIKLRDALFLVHPKAKDEGQQVIFNKIANNELTTPYTWETELSALGKHTFATVEEKTQGFTKKWEELIDSNKVGYMALLRNLRNIVEANVSFAHMAKVCSTLASEYQVLQAKQFPFRFLAAYREIKKLQSPYVSMILDALEDAAKISVKNMKGFDNEAKILIACDVSGSMQKAVSPRSKILLYDIGLMLGMLVQSKSKQVITGMFGDTWKIIQMPTRNVLANVDEFYRREGEVGYATNGYKVIEDLNNRGVKMDKIMLFTDCQMWNSNGWGNSFEKEWKKYKQFHPKAKLYLFDLAGYGTSPIQMKEHDVYLIAGWSDKIFDVLQSLENGQSVIEKIKQIELLN